MRERRADFPRKCLFRGNEQSVTLFDTTIERIVLVTITIRDVT